jgi:hypothetical protein
MLDCYSRNPTCEITWEISPSSLFKDAKNPTYEELLKIFKLPSQVDISSDQLILDACGEHLKSTLQKRYAFPVSSIIYNARALTANIVWLFDIEDISYKICKASPNELSEIVGVPIKIELPPCFSDEASKQIEFTKEFVDSVKSYLEDEYAYSISTLHISNNLANTPKTKQTALYVEYRTYAYIKIEYIEKALSISWDDVLTIRVEGLTMYITTDDGKELTYELEDWISTETDPKSFELKTI